MSRIKDVDLESIVEKQSEASNEYHFKFKVSPDDRWKLINFRESINAQD
jgi:hypothetical protein